MRAHLPALKHLAAATLLAGGGIANASITIHTDEASFLAAAAGLVIGTDGYDDLPIKFIPGPLFRSAGSNAYTANVNTDYWYPEESAFWPAGNSGNTALSTNLPGSVITFDGFTEVRAAGGVFFAADMTGEPTAWRGITVTATDAGGTVEKDFAGRFSFLGFVSDNNLSSMSVYRVYTPSTWPAVDDLTLGSVVPEPAAMALMLAGVAAVGSVARRRQAAV